MANPLPPPPLKSPDGSYAWLDWYRKLQQYVSQGGSVPWNVIDFTNSNLADIAIKNHNVLDNIQGGTTGEFYHLTAAEHTAIGTFVPNTRNLTAGAGLTGGGNLTADRTFDVVAGDGSITVGTNSITVGVINDTQHGNRGGGALHANATTSTAGFMSGADKTKIDAINTSTWSTYTPTVTAFSGTLTTVANQAGRYQQVGKAVHLVVRCSITTNGTGAGGIIFTLPVTAATVSPAVVWHGAGREDGLSGSMLQASIGSAGTTMGVLTYNNAYPGGSGAIIEVSITYEAA